MRVLRLSWAGLEITAGATTILLDYVENTNVVAPWAGQPVEPFVRFARAADSLDVKAGTLRPGEIKGSPGLLSCTGPKRTGRPNR